MNIINLIFKKSNKKFETCTLDTGDRQLTIEGSILNIHSALTYLNIIKFEKERSVNAVRDLFFNTKFNENGSLSDYIGKIKSQSKEVYNNEDLQKSFTVWKQISQLN